MNAIWATTVQIKGTSDQIYAASKLRNLNTTTIRSGELNGSLYLSCGDLANPRAAIRRVRDVVTARFVRLGVPKKNVRVLTVRCVG